MTFSTRVLRFSLKDKHATLLRELAREVNFVWNFVNELSLKAYGRCHNRLGTPSSDVHIIGRLINFRDHFAKSLLLLLSETTASQ